MKHTDVKVGEIYLTKIGDSLGRVVVVVERTLSSGRAAFLVRREGQSGLLQKPRTAAALRPLQVYK